MSGLDATFLYVETPTTHMHVCATIVFDPSTVPGGYSFEGVKEMIRSRLHLVPPFRRKLAPVPFNIHHPVWVEDEDFDLDYHLRRIGCPSPGSERELADICADVASRPLDRTRPLWEIHVVEGLQNGHVASIAKMHHCTIDGVSGANMMVHLFDLSSEGEEKPPPDRDWQPERTPSDLERVGHALWSRVRQPLKLAGIVPNTVKSIWDLVQTRIGRESDGMPAPFSAPRTPFNKPVTAHRKVAYATTSLDEIKAVKHAFDVKVNDVVLAVAAGALRRYLESQGAFPDKSLTAVVPVSVRTEGEKDLLGTNKVSAMFTSLATDIDDPVDRLRRIAEVNRGAKEEHKAIGAHMLQDWAEFAAPTTFSLAARMYSQRWLSSRTPVPYNVVISNVPGPPYPLYFAGAKIMALYPLGPIFHGMGLNITVLSYLDGINWGFMACRDQMPGLWELAAAIPEAQADLVKAAEQGS